MIFFLACSVPDAPETLDLLGSYLFTEYANPDERYMEQGMENLKTWIDANREDVQEGYRIENISIEAIEALELEHETNLEGLIGAAVATDITLSVEETIEYVILADPMEISPDAYGYFEREWDGDVDCFLRKECKQIDYDADMHNYFPLGIEISSKVHGQYQWIMAPSGDYVIQRRWMKNPGISNKDWFQVDQDYALTIYMPNDGGLRFMDMEWIVTLLGDIPVPEDFAIGLAIDSITKNRKRIESYIIENQ